MKFRTCMAVAVAAAFAMPLAAQAGDGERSVLAQAGGPSGASAMGTGPTGGAPRTGGPGPAQASTGEPKAFTGHPVRGAMRSSDFTTIDANKDGNISRAEWDRHMRAGADSSPQAPSATSGATTGAQTGVTAGPGTVSPRVGTGSATATRPDTSGHGTPK